MTREIDLARPTVAVKDALILSPPPLIGRLEAALARIAELEARLARPEKPTAHTYAAFRAVVSTAKANARSVLSDIRGVLATASASEATAPVG